LRKADRLQAMMLIKTLSWILWSPYEGEFRCYVFHECDCFRVRKY